ncbi:DUF1653 domain-containing protein [Dubosiella muris]|uniref:DUF1653 domain-containing protein n=1 Tax=Dubosiella muris TaxID=3038133 RepID=A0AC61R9A3_9FIRM|nr:DUF1653 domain-containing protein [Dubosiella muris]TGY66522.1 DUF1653 domain-containing protein [Dubosiella muris]
MERVLECGALYRHFKGGLYRALFLARRAEDETVVVVYEPQYAKGTYWTRALDEFLSEVDHQKYPDAGQRYRFEKIENETEQ